MLTATFLGALVLLGAPSVARAASQPKPVISSFTATALVPNTVLPASTRPDFYDAGGFVWLQATVSGAVTCEITANRPVLGLPSSGSCGAASSTVVELPPNTKRRALTYRFRLGAAGRGVARAGVSASVSTVANPNSVIGVTPGSTWYLSTSSAPGCPINLQHQRTQFGTGLDLYTGQPGNYAFPAPTLQFVSFTEPGFPPVYEVLSFTWDPAHQDYDGTATVLSVCTWTLTPT